MTLSLWIHMIAELCGGVGILIFGMNLMSGSLQKFAGEGLKKAIATLTSNRFSGTFVGLVVTATIQSSSATTVMVVGFVNAGLMNLTQALSVILGANLGTTITAQLMAFSIAGISLPVIAIGMLFKSFSKNARLQYFGEILIGFGMLFLALEIIKNSVIPLRQSDIFSNMFVYFSSNPVLAVLAGAIVTAIIHSSTATVGITMALASTGLIDFYAACAFVLGENIGTTVTANISALGANRAAKQAAFGHFLYNVIGVFFALIFLNQIIWLVELVTPNSPDFLAADGTKPYISRHIANFHTGFNILSIIFFLPFINYLAKLCEIFIKPAKDDKSKIVRLSDNLMTTPAIAVVQAKNEVVRMSVYAEDMIKATQRYFVENDSSELKNVKVYEEYLDVFDREISNFLVKLSMKNISESSASQINRMQHVIHNLEKIGDFSESIHGCIKKIRKKEIVFSEDASNELKELYEVVLRFYQNTIKGYVTESKASPETEDEDIIDSMRKRFRKNHIKRLNDGECSIDAGLIFVDILNCLEKIGDQTFNIAQILMTDEDTVIGSIH